MKGRETQGKGNTREVSERSSLHGIQLADARADAMLEDLDFEPICYWMSGCDEAATWANQTTCCNQGALLCTRHADFVKSITSDSGPCRCAHCGRVVQMRMFLRWWPL